MTTSLKTCFKCNTEKPATEFYRHPMMADGRLNKCKDCTRLDARIVRARRIDHYRAYDRARGSRRTVEDTRHYRANNPAKNRAHLSVARAIKRGTLLRPAACESCDTAGPVHGHHDDYAKPLEVRWLCAACHQQWHAAFGEARNSGEERSSA